MITKNDLLKQLENDLIRLDKRIKYRKLYNVCYSIIRLLIKAGIGINYMTPYILSFSIMFSVYLKRNNLPIKKDLVSVKTNIEIIDSYNGIHITHKSNNKNYMLIAFYYSSAWKKNKSGLYERKEIYYNIDKNIQKVIDAFENDEDLSTLFEVSNVKYIVKEHLNVEDEKYFQDDYYLVTYDMKETGTYRYETTKENILNSLSFISLVGLIGYMIHFSNKIIFKIDVKNKLLLLDSKYSIINEEELIKLKEIYEMKLENLSMLEDINLKKVKHE